MIFSYFCDWRACKTREEKFIRYILQKFAAFFRNLTQSLCE